MRRQLGRLDHHAIAGGDRPDRGRERELQRIVPGRDDADYAERLRDQAVLGRHELQRGVDAPRRHPFLQVLCGVLDLDIEKQRLGDGGFDRGAVAEIGRDRLLEPRLVLLDRRAQPPQPVDPDIAGGQGLGARGLELGMEGLVERGQSRAFQGLVHHGISPCLVVRVECPTPHPLCRHSGARQSREPGIHNHRPGLWIEAPSACSAEAGKPRRTRACPAAAPAKAGTSANSLHFRSILPHLTCHKNEKSAPDTLSKADRHWYTHPAPAALWLAGCLLRKPFGTENRRSGQPWPYSLFSRLSHQGAH